MIDTDKVNTDKTKLMATLTTNAISLINNEKLQRVDTFKYQGAPITDDAECTEDIHARLGNSLRTLCREYSNAMVSQ